MVARVLTRERATPRTSAVIYTAIVQSTYPWVHLVSRGRTSRVEFVIPRRDTPVFSFGAERWTTA
jgi:hypothetical protein